LAGKKITLSFSPAGQADADLIASFLPAPNADGTPFSPSQVPSLLPGYLIHLKPELRIKGDLVATGPAFAMGAELVQQAAYFNPALGTWEPGEPNRPTVGEYIATALNLQGISEAELSALRSSLETTKARLEHLRQNPGDLSVSQTLSKETLPGDLLYSTVLSYFAAIDSAAQISARSAKIRTVRMPSFGNFGMAASVQFYFGTPRNVGFPAFQMDIDRVIGSEVAKDGNNLAVVAFRRAVGATYSANEHLVPERLFNDPDRPANDPAQPQALSAVKALAVAASQGQRIYILNSQNADTHSTAINRLSLDPDVKQEIANALAVGMEVIVHEARIFLGGAQGSGHIVIDPQTGAGAYKISTGASGGYVVAQGGMALFYLIQLISGLRTLGFVAGMLLVSNPVSAGVLLLVAAVTLLGALLADNPYQTSTLSQQLLVITTLTTIGALVFVISPILFAFVFFALLLYIARILVGFWLTLNRWRDLLNPYARRYA
jgi:hypothetical protein